MKNKQYIIPEEQLEQIKKLLLRLSELDSRWRGRTDELFLKLNYVKEYTKECKCE